MRPSRSFCSRRARASNTALYGTATEAHTWLLVEVPAPWGRKALAESELPPDVKAHLMDWEAADGRRVQFIRRETKRFESPGRVRVFLAQVDAGDAGAAGANPSSQALYQGWLTSYADLLEEPYFKRMEEPWARLETMPTGVGRLKRRREPLFLTCTNGRRDACCAKWGRPMASAMADVVAEAAWQTSHLGGHRFAPTLLVLPHGSQYGWLEPEEAAPLVRAHRGDRIYRLDRYRGHTAFARPVQAAAAILRERLGVRAVDAVAPVEAVQNEDSVWQVRLRVGEDAYDMQLAQEEGERLAASCGAAPEATLRFVMRSCILV